MITDDTLTIRNTMDNINETYDKEKTQLHNYQYRIKEYMTKNDVRGLLLYLEPGFGKSILAASITEFFRTHDPNRKIILVMSKSLQNNFASNIKKYIRMEGDHMNKYDIDNIIKNKYSFVSLNASNMYSQITATSKSKTELEYERVIEKLNDSIVTKSDFLNNKLLIIDEVHNLCTGIKNGAENAVKLYNSIMGTKNLKLLFLTGTPASNTPFELVPLFNMLRGYSYEKRKKYTLFPENQYDFNQLFVHMPSNISNVQDFHIKNKSIFQNRITGLVSYYGQYFFNEERKEGFPDQLPITIEKIPMSKPQLEKYFEAREIELKEPTYLQSKTIKESFAPITDKVSTSYRVRSRMVSNFLIPPYAIEVVTTKNSKKYNINKNIRDIKKEDLLNLDKFSPKFKQIIANIESRPNELSVVYSEFVETGIELFALVLESRGYQYWHKSQSTLSDDIDEFDIENTIADKPKSKIKKSAVGKVAGKYALISGKTPYNERNNVLKVFNSKNNINGELISILLISKSSSEGLTLKNVRSIHIMEPFWNYARIEQVIARGSRIGSHENLPESERTIHPYIYLSVYPHDYKPLIEKEKQTTDEELLVNALANKKLIDEFNIAMIESSIDCSVNKTVFNLPDDKLKCHLCAPTGKKLYTNNIENDIKSDVCVPIITTEVDVKKIKMDGVDYYYNQDGKIIKIYKLAKEFGKYIEINKNDPVYADIVRKILKF